MNKLTKEELIKLVDSVEFMNWADVNKEIEDWFCRRYPGHKRNKPIPEYRESAHAFELLRELVMEGCYPTLKAVGTGHNGILVAATMGHNPRGDDFIDVAGKGTTLDWAVVKAFVCYTRINEAVYGPYDPYKPGERKP